MIEVQLRPGVPGCVTMPLGCLSLGLVPLLTRWGEGHFARHMDERGVETARANGLPGASLRLSSGRRDRWDRTTRLAGERLR